MAKMTKMTKFKVPKSPSKSHIGSSTGGKKTGRIHQKTAAAVASEAQKSEASGDELEHATNALTLKAPARIVWDKFPEWTEHLLDYLDTHTDVTINDDEAVRADFVKNPSKCVKAINNYITNM